jgi:NADH:ubiquinone oxidoreductase subunit 5 (subunit L)/multisubunit Na+/H+ antiporter MnhA subunit
LGHAAFCDKPRREDKGIKEAPLSMLIPMIILALTCVFFGVFNRIPINDFIQPILGRASENHNFAGWPSSLPLVLITIAVLAAALIHHYAAAKIKGSGLKAADHIHHAPVLSAIYRWAEKKYFDPYELGVKLVNWIAGLLSGIDKSIDWFYDFFTVKAACGCSMIIRKAHAGYYIIYVVWALTGALLVTLFAIK